MDFTAVPSKAFPVPPRTEEGKLHEPVPWCSALVQLSVCKVHIRLKLANLKSRACTYPHTGSKHRRCYYTLTPGFMGGPGIQDEELHGSAWEELNHSWVPRRPKMRKKSELKTSKLLKLTDNH